MMEIPPSSECFASILPWWAVTIFSQMASPRPEPPVLRFREVSTRNSLSNNLAMSSSVAPGAELDQMTEPGLYRFGMLS